MKFSKMPSGWVRAGILKQFRGGADAGDSMAALKLFLIFCLRMDYITHKTLKGLTLIEIENWSGLSKPTIYKGLRILCDKGLVRQEKEGRENTYEVTTGHERYSDDFDSYWGMLPKNLLLNTLNAISNRGSPATLAAYKVYIALITFRLRPKQFVVLGYEKIRELTGLQSIHVRSGIDVLINHRLVKVDYPSETMRASFYTITGLKGATYEQYKELSEAQAIEEIAAIEAAENRTAIS